MNLYRYVRGQTEPIIVRWNGIKAFDDYGLYGCGRQDDGTATNEYMPLYLYDLTAVTNSVTGSDTGGVGLYRMKLNKAAGTVAFESQLHWNNAGASSSAVIREKSGSTSSVFNPHEKGVWKWSDIKMNLWGCRSKVTRWTVQLVRFTDDDLDPAVASPVNAQSFHSFWQALIKQQTYNPIATTNGYTTMRKSMKVIKTYTLNQDATTTLENDIDPKVQTLKWFLKMDRMIDYRNRGSYLATSDDVVADEDFAIAQAQVNTTPEFRERYFLLIRASAFTRDVSAYPDISNTVTPTFDLVVRNCHIPQ